MEDGGRQSVFLGHIFEIGRFTPDERAHYVRAYGAPQFHAAFEIYRSFPRDAEWNAAQTGANAVPLLVAVGERSFLAHLLPTFVDGYRANGMAHVEGARIADAVHFVMADNPDAVADLIERHAGPP